MKCRHQFSAAEFEHLRAWCYRFGHILEIICSDYIRIWVSTENATIIALNTMAQASIPFYEQQRNGEVLSKKQKTYLTKALLTATSHHDVFKAIFFCKFYNNLKCICIEVFWSTPAVLFGLKWVYVNFQQVCNSLKPRFCDLREDLNQKPALNDTVMPIETA